MDLGPHAIFIWSAYAAATIILLALSIWLIAGGTRLKRALDDLDGRGGGRRSRRDGPGEKTQ